MTEQPSREEMIQVWETYIAHVKKKIAQTDAEDYQMNFIRTCVLMLSQAELKNSKRGDAG